MAWGPKVALSKRSGSTSIKKAERAGLKSQLVLFTESCACQGLPSEKDVGRCIFWVAAADNCYVPGNVRDRAINPLNLRNRASGAGRSLVE
jgi:hypothetical protein